MLLNLTGICFFYQQFQKLEVKVDKLTDTQHINVNQQKKVLNKVTTSVAKLIQENRILREDNDLLKERLLRIRISHSS